MRRNPRRQSRVKMSTMFATYVESVNTKRHLLDRNPAEIRLLRSIENKTAAAPLSHTSPQIARLVDTGDQLSVSSAPSQAEAVMVQELETVQRNAVAQAEVIAIETLNYLANKGYTPKDFAIWNWILTQKTAEDAALRLQLVSKPASKSKFDLGNVPVFLLQQLLLRNDVSAEALSILIRQAWQLLDSAYQSNPSHDGMKDHNTHNPRRSVGLDELTITVVRLLRHARTTWPAACISIAELWVKHATIKKDTSRLSFTYNQVLQILALPSNESPYQSLRHRQRAQFVLIRWLDNSKLPLIIAREGYRAVAMVQCAHPKTANERKWASLMAPSWPPYKEDKLGIDADIGPEFGISRANKVLDEAAERGYSPLTWEKTAAILAGRDTDGSPTIQTRSIAAPISMSSVPRGGVRRHQLSYTTIWLARIRATRTLQEAWMCFLACKSTRLAMTPQLYHAIIEKVVYDEKRGQGTRHVEDEDDRLRLPGDGKEVAESSASHNQAISTQEPLPTLDSLLEQMKCDKVQPSGRLLEFLLIHARSYDEGIRVLQASTLSDPVKASLVSSKEVLDTVVAPMLRVVPDWLFAAHINFLCKFSQQVTARSGSESTSMYVTHDSTAASSIIRDRLRHAFELVVTRKPFYRPPWNSLLMALSRHTSSVIAKKPLLGQGMNKFERACALLEFMDAINLDIDFTGFGHLCAIVSKSIMPTKNLASQDGLVKSLRGKATLDAGLQILKHRFAQLVRPTASYCRGTGTTACLSDYSARSDDRGTDCPPTLPRLFRVPHPTHLHLYIRCLSQYGDCDGLVEFMHWLVEFLDEVIEEAKAVTNGRTMFRRCLTALQAYEGSEDAESLEDHKLRYEGAVSSLSDAIDKRKDVWEQGVWPTDEDVQAYSSKEE
ncbi:MAG: hypothetical protein Q9166_006870 [cf. Caloplaca sp. 2 TL-2023]